MVIYLVQRKNVNEFNIRQTGIQSAILSIGLITIETLLSMYTKAIEMFELDINDSMYSCDIKNNSESIDCVKNDNQYKLESTKHKHHVMKPTPDKNTSTPQNISTSFDDNDFNEAFDRCSKNPPKFDSCKENDVMTNHLQQNAGFKFENTLDTSATTSGYTCMNPALFRTPESQPPICLTDKPCSTQPVVISTSMGREFLPYSKVKSNIPLDNMNEESDKHCMIGDTVFNI